MAKSLFSLHHKLRGVDLLDLQGRRKYYKLATIAKNEITRKYYIKRKIAGKKILKRGHLDEINIKVKVRNKLNDELVVTKDYIRHHLNQNFVVIHAYLGHSSPLEEIKEGVILVMTHIAQIRHVLHPLNHCNSLMD